MIGIAMHEGQRDQRCERYGPSRGLRLHRRLASSPAGRMNIMTMKNANAST